MQDEPINFYLPAGFNFFLIILFCVISEGFTNVDFHWLKKKKSF